MSSSSRYCNNNFSVVVIIFCFCWTFTHCDESLNATNATDGSGDYYEYDDYVSSCLDGDTYRNIEDCVNECWYVHEMKDIPDFNKTEGGKMRYKVVMLEESEFSIASDGSLQSSLPKSKLPPNTYSLHENVVHVCYPLDKHFTDCLKWFLFPEEYGLFNKSRRLWVHSYKKAFSVGEFYIDKVNNESLVCKNQSGDAEDTYAIDAMFLAAYSISAMSLFFTFILSLMMPELNIRNNKILMCHMVILSFAYWLLIAWTLIPKMNSRECLVFSLLKQFSFLGSFFWVNVQAIDLFIRFLNIRGTKNSRSETLKFVIYSLYAWGCPFVICMITLAMEKSKVTFLHPNFAKHCWFDNGDKLTGFVYFYGPIALILFANVILFILTISKLYSVGKHASNVNKKMHNQLLQLYLKLVVVMGLCWIMEVISWAAGGKRSHWYFTDLVNALQGLFIFIIYICKPSYIRRVVYSNSFFPNRPAWWPWKGNNADHVPGTKTEHGTLSTSTSFTGTDVQSHAI